MLKYTIKRFLEAIPVMLIVITLTFVMMKTAPGGPFSKEKKVPDAVLEALNQRYRLDQPLYIQYFDTLKNTVKGDFGPSFRYAGRTVNEMILEGLPETAELGLYALLFALVLGISSGIIAALKKNTWLDYIPMTISMAGICVPSFLLGPTLVLFFSIYLGWFPVTGWDTPMQKILPSITLGAAYAAFIARLARGGMLEILAQDFIRTARAKGVSETKVLLKHALKGGMFPVVSFLGPAVAGLLAGGFVVESIFQIPGLGRYYIQAAFNRDYTMIMGTTVFLASLIVFFNFVSDVLLIWMNPKLNFGKAK
ncbi:MAG: ABC transporter permease subunit [Bdellovibrionota bacterium]